MENLPLPQADELGAAQLLVRSVHAEADGLSLPDQARAQLSYLSLPGETAPEVLACLQTALADLPQLALALAPRPTPAPSAYLLAESHPAIAWVQELAAPILGHVPPCVWGISVADENVLARWGLPVLSLAPLGGASHRAGEWVSCASLVNVTAVYTALLQKANLGIPSQESDVNALTRTPAGSYKEA